MAAHTFVSPTVIVFDYGNVLVHPPKPATAAVMAGLCGLTPEEYDQRFMRFRVDYDQGLLDDHGYWEAIGNGCVSAAPATVSALVELDTFAWGTVNVAALEWLLTLHRTGRRIALLSNMPTTLARRYETLFGWFGLFETRIFSADLGINKPDPQIYMTLCERLRCAPQEILFIDDMDRNVAAALGVGLQAERYQASDGYGRLGEIAARYRLPAPPQIKEHVWQTA